MVRLSVNVVHSFRPIREEIETAEACDSAEPLSGPAGDDRRAERE